MKTVVCALGAGTLSALGLLLAPVAFDFVHTEVTPLAASDLDGVGRFFAGAEADGRRMLSEVDVKPDAVRITRYAELRYAGQGYEVGVQLPDELDAGSLRTSVQALFEVEYGRLYGRIEAGNVIEMVNWRAVVSGPPGDIRIEREEAETKGGSIKGKRRAYFPEVGGFVETTVYDRYALALGDQVTGPAVVEEKESTAVIPPGWSGQIDEFHNLILERDVQGARTSKANAVVRDLLIGVTSGEPVG